MRTDFAVSYFVSWSYLSTNPISPWVAPPLSVDWTRPCGRGRAAGQVRAVLLINWPNLSELASEPGLVSPLLN